MDVDKLKALSIQPEAKRRSHSSLWIIFLLVLLLTAVGVFFALPKKGDERRIFDANKGKPVTQYTKDSAAPAPTPANTPPPPAPAVAPGSSVLIAPGYIVNRERIELSPRFMGMVKWIGVRKGDAVTNGQIVVLLDDAEYRARLLEAEGRLANAQSAVAKARLDFDRVKKLIREKVETQQAEDDARLRLEAAQATVQEVQGMVELARTYLDWTVIRSTINGVVLEKLVDTGELVTPQSFGGTRGPSTALVAVADLKDLQVEIDLNEADLAKVSLNQRCRVSPEAYPDKHYEGYVAEIAPEANRQKGTLQVKVQIKNPDRYLTPELSAKVDFLK